MEHWEKTLEQSTRFEGRVVKVTVDRVLLEDGRQSTREVVHHNGGACVLPLTQDGQVYLVRQFRYAFGQELWELPAGKLEPGEAPLEAAKRELEEECGLRAEQYRDLGPIYPTVGYCTEIIYTWLATDLTQCQAHLDEGEFLTCHSMPFEQALNLVMTGEIRDSKTVAALLKVHALRTAGAL